MTARPVGRSSDTVRVRLHCSWDDDAGLREGLNSYTAGSDYRWRELELVSEGDDYDVLVVFNHPLIEDLDPARTVVLECEPAPIRERERRRISYPREAFAAYFDVERHHALGFAMWPTGRNYESHRKSRLLSAVVSSKSYFPPQLERQKFVAQYLSRIVGFDHFGRGPFTGPAYRGAIADKADALLLYRYTFAAENWREPNYFTEKLLDAIVCETLCFYDGCPNIELYIDPAVLVRIDTRQPEEALAIVQSVIAGETWKERIDAIRAQKERLRTELNPLEIIRKLVVGEPIVWRPDRDPLTGLDDDDVIRIDARDDAARREALERVARGHRPEVVLDARAQLTDCAAQVMEAVRRHVRDADLVALGGTGVATFAEVAALALPGGRALRYAAVNGNEQISAYCVSPGAARTILRRGDRLPGSIVLRSVDPPIAYVPGPLMRGDGPISDVSLVPPPGRPLTLRLSETVVPRLPRGRRVAMALLRRLFVTRVSARHAWARVRG